MTNFEFSNSSDILAVHKSPLYVCSHDESKLSIQFGFSAHGTIHD